MFGTRVTVFQRLESRCRSTVESPGCPNPSLLPTCRTAKATRMGFQSAWPCTRNSPGRNADRESPAQGRSASRLLDRQRKGHPTLQLLAGPGIPRNLTLWPSRLPPCARCRVRDGSVRFWITPAPQCASTHTYDGSCYAHQFLQPRASDGACLVVRLRLPVPATRDALYGVNPFPDRCSRNQLASHTYHTSPCERFVERFGEGSLCLLAANYCLRLGTCPSSCGLFCQAMITLDNGQFTA